MSITKKEYGTAKTGEKVYCYTLDNGAGLAAEIITYGGIVKNLYVNDKNGKKTDVVLGRNTLEDYFNNHGYLGALIGRHANRLENAEFTLGGAEYKLGANDGKANLHGGFDGFNQRVWQAEEGGTDGAPSLVLTLTSPDGDEGFPGEVRVSVTYTVTENNALRIEYRAVSDKDTIVNLTNHSYFNLEGYDSGKTVDNHILQMNASFYTPNNKDNMPCGEVLSVSGTPFDFRTAKTLGEGFMGQHEQVKLVGGFDHNFVIDGAGMRRAATISCKENGITMEVWTTQSGMQLYTANMLAEGEYKNGSKCGRHSAYCFETQCFPNAMRHRHFPGPVLRAGEEYHTITEYVFDTKDIC